MVHNRWHPDIPMVAYVKPGQDFIVETYDWTGGFIKNDDSPTTNVRDIDLSIVHFLSGPIGVEGAEPGDLLVVDLLDIGAKPDSQWGFNGFFSKQNGGGFLTDHFPWPRSRSGTSRGCSPSRATSGRALSRVIHPGLIGCLPDPKLLATWNERETALIATNPSRVPGLANPPLARPPIWAGSQVRRRTRRRRKAPAPSRRGSMAAIATSRTCRAARRSTSRSTSRAPASRWAIAFQPGRRGDHLLRRDRDGRMGPSQGRGHQGRHGEVRDQEPDLQAVADRPALRRPSHLRGISVDESGGQHYLDVTVAYRQACLNAIEYLKKFGYSAPRPIRSSAPRRSRAISRASSTCRMPARPCGCRPASSTSTSTQRAGPTQYLDGSVQMPISPDK